MKWKIVTTDNEVTILDGEPALHEEENTIAFGKYKSLTKAPNDIHKIFHPQIKFSLYNVIYFKLVD